ncbi:MAG: hypothetical protein ACI87N_001762, partial [Flavobacteriales bacterium]
PKLKMTANVTGIPIKKYFFIMLFFIFCVIRFNYCQRSMCMAFYVFVGVGNCVLGQIYKISHQIHNSVYILFRTVILRVFRVVSPQATAMKLLCI